jgi:DNA-binding SARP family transcriptional activator
VVELRVRLLGGLVVEGLAAREVGSRKARTLLAAVAVARGGPVATDALAEVLWPDELPAKPADQIGVLVSRLRGVLGADRLVRSDAGYALGFDWLDVAELEARTAAAVEQLGRGEAIEARLNATMALDLARGPLLPEEDGPWLDAPRAAVDRALSTAGLVAAEAALAVGDAWGAAAAASIGLERDPYDEAALRSLMRAHAAAGRPASALAAYAEVRARLAEDLGVSPAPETEALHQSLLGEEAPSSAPGASEPTETWDPLVHRARLELAAFDVDAAQRDAEEAVRRGAGPGALEVAGWVAYYRRDFRSALRWAEEGAAGSPEDERRASCLALAGRVLHSSGDLAGADARLAEATTSAVAGVRNVAEVWLSGLRGHQGRPDEALALADRGATDAAALRHPFVMPHALFVRAYSLGQQGRLAELVQAVDRWESVQEELGEGSARYRTPVANMRSWALAAGGERAQARPFSEWARDHSDAFGEPRAHATLDLAQLSLDDGDLAGAQAWVDRAEVAERDEDGSMVWHQRQRVGLLTARIAWRCGDLDGTEEPAQTVLDDARRRGSTRPLALAELLVLLARLRRGDTVAMDRLERVLAEHDRVAGLEAWRATAEAAAVTGDATLAQAARRRAALLVDRAGDLAPSLGRWVDQELTRLRV